MIVNGPVKDKKKINENEDNKFFAESICYQFRKSGAETVSPSDSKHRSVIKPREIHTCIKATMKQIYTIEMM